MSYQLEAVRAFNKIPLLSSLTEDETFEIVRICKIHTFKSGDTIFRQGEDGTSLFIIESGNVDILLERESGHEVVAKFGAYDAIGELALLDPGPRSATARTTSAAVVYEVRSADFEMLKGTMSPAAYKMLRALSRIVCRRIRSVHERIDAQLSGAEKPQPHTGSSEKRTTGRAAAITGAHNTTGAPPVARTKDTSQHAAVGSETPTGFFKKLVSRVWGAGDEK
jgi:CRP-like cAMP-binding protein